MKNTKQKLTDKELLKLGITRTSIDVYQVGTYKYNYIEHALAEAERVSDKAKC